jgi:type III pantothenate kinase
VIVTGGAGWKVIPHLGTEHELVDSLLFDGLLVLESQRLRMPSPAAGERRA